MLKNAILLVLAAALACPAEAAMLRPLTLLAGPVVRLSDLFDDAGAQAAHALGPAPAPGESITVEAPQLAAIARQFGVAWRPASSADRAMLQRVGVALPREDVLAVLRAALDQAGAGEGDIDAPGLESPLVAPEAHARPTIEQLDFDRPSGRFTAAVTVSGDGMMPLHLRVAGRLEAVEEVLVASRRLVAGEAVTAADLRPARVRAASVTSEVVRAAAQAEGMALRRAVLAGQPLPLADLARPMAVARGARVAMQLDAPGLTLSSTGEALEAGPVGARIRVLNPSSRAILLAEIVAPGTVQVQPGSLPLRTADDPGARRASAGGALP